MHAICQMPINMKKTKRTEPRWCPVKVLVNSRVFFLFPDYDLNMISIVCKREGEKRGLIVAFQALNAGSLHIPVYMRIYKLVMISCHILTLFSNSSSEIIE